MNLFLNVSVLLGKDRLFSLGFGQTLGHLIEPLTYGATFFFVVFGEVNEVVDFGDFQSFAEFSRAQRFLRLLFERRHSRFVHV